MDKPVVNIFKDFVKQYEQANMHLHMLLSQMYCSFTKLIKSGTKQRSNWGHNQERINGFKWLNFQTNSAGNQMKL